MVWIPNWRQEDYLKTNSAGVYSKETACNGHHILHPAALQWYIYVIQFPFLCNHMKVFIEALHPYMGHMLNW